MIDGRLAINIKRRPFDELDQSDLDNDFYSLDNQAEALAIKLIMSSNYYDLETVARGLITTDITENEY